MAVVVVAFFVVRLISGNPMLALLAAALYAVNPSRVEAVSWSYSDSYLVFSLFSLIALWCFILRRYLASIAAFVIALLSQESAVLFPVVLLAYLYCYSDRQTFRNYLPVLPFFLLVAVFLLMRANAVGIVPLTDIGLWPWLNAAVTIVTTSVKAFFVPEAAISIYQYRPGMFTDFGLLTAVSYVVTLLLLAVGVWLWREQRDFLFWYLWFFIWIAVMFNVGKYAEYYFMDKILYLACLGFCVLLAKMALSIRQPGTAMAAVVGTVLVGYFFLTFWRSTFYVSTPVYLEQAIQTAPDFVPLQYSLANVYQSQGENQRAITLFEQLVRNEPQHSFAQNNLGNLYYQRGELERAMNAWKQAIKADPVNPQPYYNVAMILERQKKGREALRYYMQYLQLEPRPAAEIQRHIRQFARGQGG